MNKRPFILCADDVQKNQIMITEMLEKDFRIECINNDENECLDIVINRRPDLILLGESMPIRKDDELCKVLREDEQYQEIPIVSLTIERSSEKSVKSETASAFTNGYDLHLNAPFDEELLIASINRLLDR